MVDPRKVARDREQERQRLAHLNDHDKLIEVAMGVFTLGQSVDGLRDNGCLRYPEHVEQHANLAGRVTALEDHKAAFPVWLTIVLTAIGTAIMAGGALIAVLAWVHPFAPK